MGLIYFGIKFLRYALWSWVPFLLQNNFGQASDNAGYISTVFDIFGFAGVIFAGFVSDGLFSGILLWGDLSNYHIWFLLFIVSGFGLLGAYYCRQ